MKESQKSAVIFINVMMVLFYVSLFILMVSGVEMIIKQKVPEICYISTATLIISCSSHLLVVDLDENPLVTNITHKAKWIWKK